MDTAPTPSAVLDLPPVAARGALRAGLAAMQLRVSGLLTDNPGRADMLRALPEHPRRVAFIDISRGGSVHAPTLLELDAIAPLDESRRRVILTRLTDGHVAESDRRWARELGFADLIGEFDAADREGSLRGALDWAAQLLGVRPVSPAALHEHMKPLIDERDRGSPRVVIRDLTGMSAEGFASLLQGLLAVEDRTYHLHTYPACLVGSEAVTWIAQRFGCSRGQAVALGQALGALGLVEHVTQEHAFADQLLYYRLAVSQAVDGLDLGEVFSRLRGDDELPRPDLTYLGARFAGCWIGSQAVDVLCARYGIARHEAAIVLQRLMRFGLIQHVKHTHTFADAVDYYRFVEPAAHASER